MHGGVGHFCLRIKVLQLRVTKSTKHAYGYCFWYRFEENVGGVDVTMDYVLVVSFFESEEDLSHPLDNLGLGEVLDLTFHLNLRYDQTLEI